MESVPKPGYVAPNVRIPRVLGILNIVFASALLLCGMCSLSYLLMMPTFGNLMSDVQKKMEAQQAAEKKATLEDLDRQEKEAETEAEKAEVLERRREVESRPKVVVAGQMGPEMWRMDNPRIKAYVWLDYGTAIVLNVLLLVSGIGLVMRRTWGVSLGLWTAALKLVRLLLVYGYFAIAVVPDFALWWAKLAVQSVTAQFQAQGKAVPPGMAVDQFVRVYSIMLTVWAVGFIVFGSIYPAVSLWLLSRPGVREACSAEGKAPEVDDTW